MRFYGPEEITQMTTHDRDKIIAASREAAYGEPLMGMTPHEIISFVSRLYAIAFEAGMKAEREDCIVIAQTPVAGEQDDITMEAKDRIANAIRARGDRK